MVNSDELFFFYSKLIATDSWHVGTGRKRLREKGIGVSDFFITDIGSAIVVFAKYQKTMDSFLPGRDCL